MGSQTQQQNQPTQVYYDPEKQQYFSYKQSESTNPTQSLLNQIMGVSSQDRLYLNSPIASMNNRVNPYTPNPATMNDLFPALNTGLLQNALNQPLDTTQSAGASRFLGVNNLLGNTSNTQNK